MLLEYQVYAFEFTQNYLETWEENTFLMIFFSPIIYVVYTTEITHIPEYWINQDYKKYSDI